MANEIEIKIPDIGGATQVDVIEIIVHVGEEISIDTPLITLETDKASMEIPSPKAGKITSISVKVGDKVSEGDTILLIQSEDVSKETKEPDSSNKAEKSKNESPSETAKPPASKKQPQSLEIQIPDIGGATDVDVIDILVKPGMKIEKDEALITLEGDKATMDIPSPYTGTIKTINLKLGDKVSQGSAILTLETNADHDQSPQMADTASPQAINSSPESGRPEPESKPESITTNTSTHSEVIAAGPAVRRMARELGVNLALVKGSGRKSRIVKEDLQSYVKARLTEKQSSGGFNLPATPVIDFSRFGEIETKPLNKIKKLTGINVHRSWITIPHVTQFDEADITDLEAFRKLETDRLKNAGFKLTILAFVCGAVSKALQVYPQFNASLDSTGENLIYKKYCNLGIAVETPNGLVVPVIKNVDKLNISEIAIEMTRLSGKARDKGLMPIDMAGGCFTISSLGGIGGTAFTPIVNAPEVAILGLSRSAIKPVYKNGDFKPRLILPLSLSYDHRVIDGAEAARFTRFICDALSDIRRILL
ncbi:acetyltransferase component of pyruvate dehydrogenase complex [Legionella antarctica]|uniref:Dihydrolipoamide acetyltransferase component of pyruvate dehydrogenase complex n=1 Tax=Legionella antarctica TaxID=2708020 RepID=A0A6F8T6B5_9GAMM|nr:dihydrolipoyllysine-residue acetyltransferase [Legionella antarctica]BCA95690.1 acetyltransferase component of pyruvate dehydrogenase complex [Legionella antarctica]